MKHRFSERELLMGRAIADDLPVVLQNNLHQLQARTTALFQTFNGPLYVSSGYRPASINAKVGGATHSLHQVCAAVDVRDSGDVWQFVLNNLRLCADIGLWVEDKRWTCVNSESLQGWVHLQIQAPKSQSRIFVPNLQPPINRNAWNGTYDRGLNGLQHSFNAVAKR